MGNFAKKYAVLTALLLAVSVLSVPAVWAASGELIPVGQTVGIRVETDGVIVVSAEGTEGSPLRAGDVIRSVDGCSVRTGEELRDALMECTADHAEVTVLRGEGEKLLSVPILSEEDGNRLGIWARDSMTGIGTVTYLDPETGVFGALGHKISDADTGIRLPIAEGNIFRARVTGVMRGVPGTPGQLQASLFEGETLGVTRKNDLCGLFGTAMDAMRPVLAPVPVGEEQALHTGSAEILTDAVGGDVTAYTAEITRIYPGLGPEGRTMMLTVTDKVLLDATGGIVQGMSGSPILQDGKLVGAVSHVLVNDPTRGYGIGIWEMRSAETASQKAA